MALDFLGFLDVAVEVVVEASRTLTHNVSFIKNEETIEISRCANWWIYFYSIQLKLGWRWNCNPRFAWTLNIILSRMSHLIIIIYVFTWMVCRFIYVEATSSNKQIKSQVKLICFCWSHFQLTNILISI